MWGNFFFMSGIKCRLWFGNTIFGIFNRGVDEALKCYCWVCTGYIPRKFYWRAKKNLRRSFGCSCII